MKRWYYSDSIDAFLNSTPEEILGQLTMNSDFPVEHSQRRAWLEEIDILRNALQSYKGSIYLEYSIPRMGKRIDTVAIIGSVIFIVEFKVGSGEFDSYAIDQVMDYALDLKNFHEPSHDCYVVPILVATAAGNAIFDVSTTPQNDKLLFPIKASVESIDKVIKNVLNFCEGNDIDSESWGKGRYCPTPTIIEAALALYNGHSVENISRSDAGAINLSQTSQSIADIINISKERSEKSICFVTGVPGAGKTLVGLNIATTHIDKNSDLYSVFLSGNGPLVTVLREALARDKVAIAKERGKKIKKGEAMSEVKMFIQNVHHFRDDCLVDIEAAPIEHVALFDEAQRAWDLQQTSNFMRRKKNKKNFNQSEPEFLISCLNRHQDWAVIVCLVGGGQEINTGEAGISEWIESLQRTYKNWNIYISSRLTDTEYGAGSVLKKLQTRKNVAYREDLHLSVSLRSFRAENVSFLIKQLLDIEEAGARKSLMQLKEKYPIVITRNVSKAKQWLKHQARGTERYGIVVSSQAERLKPHAIDVKAPINPVHWFLGEKTDVRSSYYLEDVGTEFHVQGLELDWVCVTWDADFRYSSEGWKNWSFQGNKWMHIKKAERKNYQKNAYRVLLTRARQGMVIVVPQGDPEDPTRAPEYYDPTFAYLKHVGFDII
jgi:DUF2075 family protein